MEYITCRTRANTLAHTDAGKWGTDHEIEEHAQGGQRGAEGYGVEASAGAEGVYHHGPVAEGDREGGDHHQARDHEGGE